MTRLIRVEAVQRLTPSTMRVTFAGGVTPSGPDQRVTLGFPSPRTFTVRVPDPLQIDFVLHRTGPATTWSAAPGQVLEVVAVSSGPPVPSRSDWLLLAGDETALPAIGTIVEALPAGSRAVALVEVPDEDEEQPLTSAADLTVHWVHRRAHGSLARAVRTASLPPGAAHAWLAGEAGLVRAVRQVVVAERGVASVDSADYW